MAAPIPILPYSDPGNVGRATVTNGTSNTTINFVLPANVVNGRLCIAHLICSSALNPNTLTLPGTGNWTLIRSNFSANGSFNPHTALAWKIWQTGDSMSDTCTIGGAIQDDDAIITMYRDFDPLNPINVAAATITGGTSNMTPVCVSINTTVADTLAIFTVNSKNGNGITTEDDITKNPPGTTLFYSKRSRLHSSGTISAMAYKTISAAGATGTQTWTNWLNANQYWSSFSFAINPLSIVTSIDNLNGGNNLRVGQTGVVIQTTGLNTLTTITGIQSTNINAPSGDGTFDILPFQHGVIYPVLGSKTVIAGDGTNTAQISRTIDPPLNNNAITLTSINDSNVHFLGYPYAQDNNDLEVGDVLYFLNNVGVTINADTSVTATNDVTITIARRHRPDHPTLANVMDIQDVQIYRIGDSANLTGIAASVVASIVQRIAQPIANFYL